MLEKNDAFRLAMTQRLENMLKSDVRKVILHGDDDEHVSELKERQMQKNPEQLRHFLKALQIVSDDYCNENSVTWREVCE